MLQTSMHIFRDGISCVVIGVRLERISSEDRSTANICDALCLAWTRSLTSSARQGRGSDDVKLTRGMGWTEGKKEAGKLSQEGWPRKPSIRMAFHGEAASNLKLSALSDLYREKSNSSKARQGMDARLWCNFSGRAVPWLPSFRFKASGLYLTWSSRF